MARPPLHFVVVVSVVVVVVVVQILSVLQLDVLRLPKRPSHKISFKFRSASPSSSGLV